jgi:hypothetical protein
MVTLHIICIIITGLGVLYADEQALFWMIGKKNTLPQGHIDVLHIWVSIGLSAVIATGGLLFLKRQYLLHDTTFLTKMVFVAALVINGFFIDKLSTTVTNRPFRELSSRERFPLLVSGAVSFCGWAGAGLCGLLLG